MALTFLLLCAPALLVAAAVSAGADRTSVPDDARQTAMLDEISVMLLAGHATTASFLSWLLWELAGAPTEQDAVAELIATSTAASTGAEGGSDAAVTRRLGALAGRRDRGTGARATSCWSHARGSSSPHPDGLPKAGGAPGHQGRTIEASAARAETARWPAAATSSLPESCT